MRDFISDFGFFFVALAFLACGVGVIGYFAKGCNDSDNRLHRDKAELETKASFARTKALEVCVSSGKDPLACRAMVTP